MGAVSIGVDGDPPLWCLWVTLEAPLPLLYFDLKLTHFCYYQIYWPTKTKKTTVSSSGNRLTTHHFQLSLTHRKHTVSN